MSNGKTGITDEDRIAVSRCVRVVNLAKGRLLYRGPGELEGSLRYFDSEMGETFEFFVGRLWQFSSQYAYLKPIGKDCGFCIIVPWRWFRTSTSTGCFAIHDLVTSGPISRFDDVCHAVVAWKTFEPNTD